MSATAPGVVSKGPGAVASTPAISVDEVTKVYGHTGESVSALDGISVDVAEGEFVCLVGASGCGKSTLLNLIAGLDRPTGGAISRPAGDAALMFQEAALFPWLTVYRNVELALRLAGVPRGERRTRVADLLDSVHLGDFAGKRPHELSGGMRQRVALARALAQDRKILLMDEPFGALDAITRGLLHDELERVWQETGISVVFVTHNVREAARLGDRVLVLTSRPGRVAQEFRIDLDRPRRLDSPELSALASSITEHLRGSISNHAG